MVENRERKRVKIQAEAAAFLGISKTRLQQFHEPAGPAWWQEGFRNSDGYDVVGIAKAQTAAEIIRANGGVGSGEELTPRQQKLEAAKDREAEESAKIKTLERRKREREIQLAEGELVASKIVVTLFREALADLRTRLDELPYRMSLEVPPEIKLYIFHEAEGDEPALLEEYIRELVQSFEDFWEVLSSEIFEAPEEDDGDVS